MRLVEILLLASLASLASCSTTRTPNVCCTSDPECARLGLPPGSASEYSCDEGRVCRDFYCVPKEAPIVDNGQPAELVLGQETFTTADQNHGGLSARSLNLPSGITLDEVGRLWVLDAGNNRALMWNPSPQVSFAEAALVIGSTDFTTPGGPCTASTFFTDGSQLAAQGGKLLISAVKFGLGTYLCEQVMIWSPVPTANGGAATTAMSGLGDGAADFNVPGGIWTDGTRVAVADIGNNRVLIWLSFPTMSGQPADIVLGQPGFGMSGSPTPPTGATMRLPVSVYSDGVRFFVADTGNARVLVWRSFPTTSGQPADFVIGQPDLTSNRTGHGASRFRRPTDVTAVGDHLFVADPGNHRVLVFSPIPNDSGASAASVLGHPNFNTTQEGATQETFNEPFSLVASGNKLYVADRMNHRVLRFDLRP